MGNLFCLLGVSIIALGAWSPVARGVADFSAPFICTKSAAASVLAIKSERPKSDEASYLLSVAYPEGEKLVVSHDEKDSAFLGDKKNVRYCPILPQLVSISPFTHGSLVIWAYFHSIFLLVWFWFAAKALICIFQSISGFGLLRGGEVVQGELVTAPDESIVNAKTSALMCSIDSYRYRVNEKVYATKSQQRNVQYPLLPVTAIFFQAKKPQNSIALSEFSYGSFVDSDGALTAPPIGKAVWILLLPVSVVILNAVAWHQIFVAQPAGELAEMRDLARDR